MGLLKRIYEHPKFLPIFAPFAVISFVLSTIALAMTIAQDQQIESDRISADIAGCERGNRLRLEVVAIGEANQDMVAGILDIVLPVPSDNPRVDQIRSDLAPLLAEHQARIDDIQVVNCNALVPGATTTTPKGRP